MEKETPKCDIFIDKDGRWYHRGVEMVRRDIIRLFYRHMKLTPDGTYRLELDGQRCALEVEDTAYVVWRTVLETGEDEKGDRVMLLLSDDTNEYLSPESLRVGAGDVLYCLVKGGAFPARFSRSAYYQIAFRIEEEDGRFYLPLNGRRFAITTLFTQEVGVQDLDL